MILTLLAALTVGAALGLSGAALQSVLRNPLAEPYLLGVVGGAALFAAAVIHFGLIAAGGWVLPSAAFLGAGFSLVLVCGIAGLAARRRGESGGAPETVVLAGFVTGSFTGSLEMVLLSYATPETFAHISKWLFGDLHAVQPAPLAFACVAALVSAVCLYTRNRDLNALALGDDVAAALGVRVRRVRLTALAAAALATSASVALAGAIGFVGLVVPHLVRRLVSADHRIYLPLSALGGALFLLSAEFIGRLLPGSVPAGVVCAVTGAPFFLWLLADGRRA